MLANYVGGYIEDALLDQRKANACGANKAQASANGILRMSFKM